MSNNIKSSTVHMIQTYVLSIVIDSFNTESSEIHYMNIGNKYMSKYSCFIIKSTYLK